MRKILFVLSAVREAIQIAGDFDVLVALETQVKYDENNKVESVLVTGYPGKYVNWRHSDELVTAEPKASSNSLTTTKLTQPNPAKRKLPAQDVVVAKRPLRLKKPSLKPLKLLQLKKLLQPLNNYAFSLLKIKKVAHGRPFCLLNVVDSLYLMSFNR